MTFRSALAQLFSSSRPLAAGGRPRRFRSSTDYGISLNPAASFCDSLEPRVLLSAAFPEFLDPNPAIGNQFGKRVVPLSTGNVVITSPYDDAGGTDAGAVYLFNGATGALISTLTGSSANNHVGLSGIVELSNGNFVVISAEWDNGAASDVGAVTFGDGVTGVSGVVSASNSLVGTQTNDVVGSGGITALANGNYVVRSIYWHNGSFAIAGAVTWGDGTTGVVGAVSASNSLVGTQEIDQVGVGGVTALTNGNYVVRSYVWRNGSIQNAGAVTWGDGTTGVIGAVSASNSLVGTQSSDHIGIGGVTALTNGNYVVGSYAWRNGSIQNAGAVTWGDGTTGVIGAVSASNSLVGTHDSDQVGIGGVTALTNGNYVVSSYFWDNGSAFDTGAVTWGDGTTGVVGAVSASNSLVGTQNYDSIGGYGVTALTNGNYVVRSSSWRNGSSANAGAATWGDGTTGVVGAVSASNSLVGTQNSDQVGSSGVTALSNGNYVIRSTSWDNGNLIDAGAVTWGDGTTGVVGAVSASNSLVGTQNSDFIGNSGITALTNGNYVVNSSIWDNGSIQNAGGATWGDGTIGVVGAVSASNSLVGTQDGDLVGIGGVTALTNGNYLVNSSNWRNGTKFSAGAVTWGEGATGVIGTVSASNSLVGTRFGDSVGNYGVTALLNGNYVVMSNNWQTSSGAVSASTFGDGLTGITGPVTVANSLIGASNAVQLSTKEDSVNATYMTAFEGEHQEAGRVRVGSTVDGFTNTATLAAALQGSTLSVSDENPGGAANQLEVVVSGSNLVLTDASQEFATRPFGSSLSNGNHTLTIPLATIGNFFAYLNSGNDLATWDYSGGAIPSTFVLGGGQLLDEFRLIGSGSNVVELTSTAAALDQGKFVIDGDGNRQIQFDGIKPRSVSDILALSLSGTVNLGSDSLTIDASSFTGLGTGTTLTGGTITAPGGLFVGGAEAFRASGIVNAPIAAAAGGTILATGNLTLGDSTSEEGFFSDGRLLVNNHVVQINDANETVLGSLTTLGNSTGDGTLDGPNGFLLLRGRNLRGSGIVENASGPFRNDGHIIATGTGLTFNGLVTGIGDFAGSVTFNGGTSFGNSPAKTVFAGNATFGSGNEHTVEIGGVTPGSDFDQLDVSGSLQLDGTLTVSLIQLGTGNAPAVGNEYEILKASGGITGTFSDVNLPLLQAGQKWNLTYGVNSVILAVLPTATGGADSFVLNYSATTVAISLSVDGGALVSLGSLPVTAFVDLPDLDSNDLLTIVGTSGNDRFLLDTAGLLINSSSLIASGQGKLFFVGGAGDDTYRFDADLMLGSIGLDESGGGMDTITFSDTTSTNIAVDLSLATPQVINSNLSLNLNSGTAFEIARGGSGNDILKGNSQNNSLVGLDGNDMLDGGGGSDSLAGGFGDDSYVFGTAISAESDIVWEPSIGGTDTLDFSPQTTAVTMTLITPDLQSVHANRTVKLNSGNTLENLIGGSGNDNLTGNSGDNILSGNAGNDRLTGGRGNDSLVGGFDDDLYVFGQATVSESDSVIESSGEGTDTLSFSTLNVAVNVSLSNTSVQNVHSNRTMQISSGDSIENLTGGSGDDVLTGNARNNVLTSNAGSDILTGLAGDDRLVGGIGDDVYLFDTTVVSETDILIEASNAGYDTLDFSILTTNVTLSLASAAPQSVHANRTIQLNSAATFENIAGGSGADVLSGNSATNILIGNDGDDQLSGNGGRDLLIGGNGQDSLQGGSHDDILIAGFTFNDSLFAKLRTLLASWNSTDAYETRVNNLRAGVGSPTVSLQAGINVFNDSSPADSLTGGSGDDWYLAAIDDVLTDILASESLDVL